LRGIHDQRQEKDCVGEILGRHFEDDECDGLVPGVAGGSCDEGESESSGKGVPGGDEEVQELRGC
jgi:hypothetical protein